MSHNVTLNDYLNQINDAHYNQDGEAVAALLSFRQPHVMSHRLNVDKPERAVANIIYPPMDEVVLAHLKVILWYHRGKVLEIWKAQSSMVTAVARFMTESKEENWMLPLMNTVCLELRLQSVSADAESARTGATKPGELLEKTADSLMACFRVCAADTRAGENDTKRWGLLYLVNQFFKIYFKINKLNLCKPMIRAIESLVFKDQYPLSQLITYKYYTGRKAMFDSDFKGANDALTFAFQRCPRRSHKNKRRILIYLLPVKMLIGYIPKKTLLCKYNLKEFMDVVIAVKSGDVRLLNKAFVQYERFFIGAGIYLILEKLKSVAYRNLFKKVFLIKQSHQLDIAVFTKALKWLQMEDIDTDETECLLANMIYEGKIKGYISHSHKKLVVSKKDAFPPLTA
ncbi:Proteasome component (PCI) domain [Trinorchestia longiramus]|nr:Proteasome component (PCI) domain [Trinorchestia longiramus]